MIHLAAAFGGALSAPSRHAELLRLYWLDRAGQKNIAAEKPEAPGAARLLFLPFDSRALEAA
jgi:hypothetical protein